MINSNAALSAPTPMIPDQLKKRMDPEFAAWLAATQVELPPDFQPTPEQMRDGFINQTRPYNGPIDPSLVVEDGLVLSSAGHNIPLRFYRHADAIGPQPTCVFIHGGGWVVGDLNTHQELCNDIAMQTNMTVVAVHYRLSPEHIYPAALDDCKTVLGYLHSQADALGVDKSKLNIIGDSAGGSLAAATSMALRRSPIAIKSQALIYPALGADMSLPSYSENAHVPGLSEAEMVFFYTSYIGGEVAPDPLAAPLTVVDVSQLPPTFITVAEFDPLRDDGVKFAEKLQDANIPVTLRIEPGVGHAYMWVRRTSPVAGQALEALCRFLVDANT